MADMADLARMGIFADYPTVRTASPYESPLIEMPWELANATNQLSGVRDHADHPAAH